MSQLVLANQRIIVPGSIQKQFHLTPGMSLMVAQDSQGQLFLYRPTLARGRRGEDLLRFAGLIPTNELQLIQQAIELDCSQVQLSEW